jgi:hypothetical protein
MSCYFDRFALLVCHNWVVSAPDSYSEDPGLNSRSGDRLYRMRFLVSFPKSL